MVSPFGDGEAGAESALASRPSSPEWLLRIAREYDRKGYLQETAGAYHVAMTAATGAGDRWVAAEALNTAGGIEQNLATVASTQGDSTEALDRYQRSLAGFLRAANEQGCAVAYHNLGVISIDLRRWADADRYLRLCLQHVTLTGDLHLRGQAVMNHAEALAEAYRVLGCVLRGGGGVHFPVRVERSGGDAGARAGARCARPASRGRGADGPSRGRPGAVQARRPSE